MIGVDLASGQFLEQRVRLAQQLLRDGKLVGAAPADLPQLAITMEVRAYRERPSGRHAAKGTAQALWAFLAGGGTARLPPS